MISWNKVLAEKSDGYRPLTFWSWNNKLENKRLKEQIGELKSAGFGGFFMHARYGLKTEYMSDEWFSAVECCIKEAQKQGMTAWCYDENGYPSGFAGMKLLNNPEYLARYLTVGKTENSADKPICVFGISKDNKPVFDNLDTCDGSVYEIYENSSPANVDVFNKKVADEFIKLTHEVYYEKFGEYFGTLISGFFTDEPQYFRYGTPYSAILAEEYTARYNEDLLQILPYLFFELDGFKEYRWKYYKLANEMYTDGFVKTLYEWCKAHNVKLTGHTIEESVLFAQMWCCAGVMPFYEYEDIPGCDWLGRNVGNSLNPKQVGSVAQQLGKKQTITESFAATGWDVTPKELKRLVDFQFAGGINLLCTHLTPYSMEGSRKYDHPAHFSSVNPWFCKFSQLAKYVTNLGCMMGESRELTKVGVIHPIHSAYLTYNRKDDCNSVKKLDDDFDRLLVKLQKYNIPYHLIDESLLAKYGSVANDRLVVGKCEYDAVVIPDMEQIDGTTAELLKNYAKNGGKVHLAGKKPSYVSGKKCTLDYLNSNIGFSDLVSDKYSVSDYDTGVSSVYRISDCGDFLFVFNSGDKTENVQYKIKANGACEFDVINKKTVPVCFSSAQNGYITVPVTLKPCESKVLLLGDYLPEASVKYTEKTDVQNVSARICGKNILTLDEAQISYDGVTYSNNLPMEGITDMLLKNRYCGKLYLKYSFFVNEKPDSIVAETEKMNCLQYSFNDEPLNFDGKGIFDTDFVTAELNGNLKTGCNELVLCIDYHQNDHVYDVICNAVPASESLINCLVYDTEIAPVTLYGNFAVTGKNGYFDENEQVYCYSAPFEISKSDALIKDFAVTSGYPFYAGDIMYSYTVGAKSGKACRVLLSERFAAAHIKWNGYETDLVLTDSVIIPDEYVKAENTVEITVTVGNRNRLGPHHCTAVREPKTVWTEHFKMSGSWHDAHSDVYNSEYAFVLQKNNVCILQRD